MSDHRIFVYGSLRDGEGAHSLLDGARSLGPARTAPGFALLDLGDYPALVPDEEGEGVVIGELYEVPEHLLPALDKYEECPALYQRELIPLEGGGQAEAYLFQGEPIFSPVPSGDWLNRS